LPAELKAPLSAAGYRSLQGRTYPALIDTRVTVLGRPGSRRG